MTLPRRLRSAIGVSEGDIVEACVQQGNIILKPKVVMGQEDLTPAHRRQIDSQLAKSIAEAKAGETYGPFDTHKDLVDFLHQQTKRSQKGKTKKTQRRGR